MTVNSSIIWLDFSRSLNEILLKIVPNADMAKEITEDILLQINHQIKTLDDQQKIITWFEEIINDIIIVYAEKHQLEYNIENGWLKDIKASSIESLSPFINLLHSKHSSILKLAQKSSIKEISEKLGMSLVATRSLLKEARTHLSRMIYVTYVDFNPELKAIAL